MKKTLKDAKAMGLIPKKPKGDEVRKIIWIADGKKLKRVRDMTPEEQQSIRKDAIEKALEFMKNSPAGQARAQTRRLIEYAQKHRFIITPVGYGYYVQSFKKFGCCPCAPERKDCPCEGAEDEINAQGCCKCHLFYRSYDAYLVLNKLVGDK